jgi:hypothetical protein
MFTDESGAHMNMPAPEGSGDFPGPAPDREPYLPPALTDLGTVSGETQSTGGIPGGG